MDGSGATRMEMTPPRAGQDPAEALDAQAEHEEPVGDTTCTQASMESRPSATPSVAPAGSTAKAAQLGRAVERAAGACRCANGHLGAPA